MEMSATDVLQVDEAYEFFAPRFFDFMNDDVEEEDRLAELWFETSLSYAPSPFMPEIKVGRSVQVQIESLCDFGNAEQAQKLQESPAESRIHSTDTMTAAENTGLSWFYEYRHSNSTELNGEVKEGRISFEFVTEVKPCNAIAHTQIETSSLVDISTSAAQIDSQDKEFAFPVLHPGNSAITTEVGTPNVKMVSAKGAAARSLKKQIPSEARTPKAEKALPANGAHVSTSKNLTSKKTGGPMKPKSQAPTTQSGRGTKLNSRCPGSTAAKSSMTTDIAQENQAIKRQKLEGGGTRQIIDVKSRTLAHKSKFGLIRGADLFDAGKDIPEATPVISTAEMAKKFQSRTRVIDLSQNGSHSYIDTAELKQRRHKLTLTRPKDPKLETAQRVRSVRVKSSAEVEEDMLAKIPKFKARPINKKILEAPLQPPLPRTAPQIPLFQEFHLKTMERASQHSETPSVYSKKESSYQNQDKPLKLTEPHPPHLETALRARPSKIKSSQELELDELEKIPKFKARPLNKKILDSKGDLGLFCNPKIQVTTPQEFHFATDERLGHPATVSNIFDKLSLHSEPHQKVPRITTPNPFHLHTEDRGIEKEKQLAQQILQKQLEEERERILKANPYPYTTDFPVIPPKPEPKKCTKPESFQLESIVRHEEVIQRKLQENQRIETEEAQRRNFKAQPIMRDDLPLPERERKPLTEVQEFALHVDNRAVRRSEFDRKIKEKEMMHKRLREEYDTAKIIEEEKAVKRMRRTMVPHARPLPKSDNPFLPQKSTKETTKPISPDLHVARREERRHPSHMR